MFETYFKTKNIELDIEDIFIEYYLDTNYYSIRAIKFKLMVLFNENGLVVNNKVVSNVIDRLYQFYKFRNLSYFYKLYRLKKL